MMKALMMKFLLSSVTLLSFGIASAQVKVTFKIEQLPASTPSPQTIFLAGSFNGWAAASQDWLLLADDKGGLQITKMLSPGSYEFKITRGSWSTVECTANGADITNRSFRLVHDTTIVLTVADWRDKHPLPERKHTASAQVHILNDKFDMPQLGRQRRVWIYLPKGYETSHKKYPVIYMHDGQNLFDEFTSGFGEWGIDEFMDSLKVKQQQSMIVGVDHGGDLRILEYSPYNSKYGVGQGDAYTNFLVETLKPYIDAHYKTLQDAKHTTVAGSSMGGLISMYAALKYPKVFGNAGIFSPAFWINPEIYNYAKAHALKTSRFYFVCGDQESDKEVADMNQMVDILQAKGLKGENAPTRVIKGAKHNESQWRGAWPGFYGWLNPSAPKGGL